MLYLWQLPQNLIGLLLTFYYKAQRIHVLDNGVEIHYSPKMRGGISLGKYIIVNTYHYRSTIKSSLKREVVQHELGHTKQSEKLGWMYLLIIGIPSIIWAMLYGRVVNESKNGYYKFYTERWADKLAGIER